MSDTKPDVPTEAPAERTDIDIPAFLRANPVAGPFKPYFRFEPDGNALTVYFKGDADYAKQLTPNIILYRAIDTDEIVGCRIDGVMNSDQFAAVSAVAGIPTDKLADLGQFISDAAMCADLTLDPDPGYIEACEECARRIKAFVAELPKGGSDVG